MPRYYAGIGSRETPRDVCLLMESLAKKLAGEGWTLRSGHADGADRAFERGAGGKAVVYLPFPSFGIEPYQDDPGMPVMGQAVCLPQVWESNCRKLVEIGVRYSMLHSKMHGRNWAQVCGLEGEGPSQMVVCWCPEPNGRPQGGTATAVNLARHLGIQVRNLWHDEVLAAAHTWLAR